MRELLPHLLSTGESRFRRLAPSGDGAAASSRSAIAVVAVGLRFDRDKPTVLSACAVAHTEARSSRDLDLQTFESYPDLDGHDTIRKIESRRLPRE